MTLCRFHFSYFHALLRIWYSFRSSYCPIKWAIFCSSSPSHHWHSNDWMKMRTPADSNSAIMSYDLLVTNLIAVSHCCYVWSIAFISYFLWLVFVHQSLTVLSIANFISFFIFSFFICLSLWIDRLLYPNNTDICAAKSNWRLMLRILRLLCLMPKLLPFTRWNIDSYVRSTTVPSWSGMKAC